MCNWLSISCPQGAAPHLINITIILIMLWGYLSALVNWWSLLGGRYAGTWMWGGGGGGVVLSLAESSWRSLAEGEAATQQGYIFTNVIRAHLNNLWNSQKHGQVLGTIDDEELAQPRKPGGAGDSSAGLYTLQISGGGVSKRLSCHFFLALRDCFLLLATTAPTDHTQLGWNAVMKQWGQNKNMPKLKANPHILHH